MRDEKDADTRLAAVPGGCGLTATSGNEQGCPDSQKSKQETRCLHHFVRSWRGSSMEQEKRKKCYTNLVQFTINMLLC